MRRHIFKYSPEPSRRGTVYRPIAYVYLQSKDGVWYLFYPYIDSGADISLFPKADASLLKLEFSEGEYNPVVGIGRVLMPAYIHNVKMRIGETVFNVEVAFVDSDEVPRLLGRKGVFERFKIAFDEANLQAVFETYE